MVWQCTCGARNVGPEFHLGRRRPDYCQDYDRYSGHEVDCFDMREARGEVVEEKEGDIELRRGAYSVQNSSWSRDWFWRR